MTATAAARRSLMAAVCQRARSRVLPTPAQLRNLADDCEALHHAVSVWADRPYHELGDLVSAIPIIGLVDQAEALGRSLRRVAHILDATEEATRC
jgi:hypothetical protein